VSAVDLALGLAEALPSGLYSGEGLERYVRRILSEGDRTDDFKELSSALFLTATDLDTCERIVSDMGFAQIGYQAFKLLAHQRLHELAGHWEERYPGVDIILIEPDPSDELMFQTSVMNFTSRVDIARHGFQSVKLANDYPKFKQICANHGIEISAIRVRKVVKHFEADHESTGAWRKILEQTTSTLLRQSAQQ
jgi:hypothetical protein